MCETAADTCCGVLDRKNYMYSWTVVVCVRQQPTRAVVYWIERNILYVIS